MDIWFEEIRTNNDFDVEEITDFSVISDDNHTLLQDSIARNPVYEFNLIARGVPLDHQDDNGQTALQYAISRGYTEIAVKIILAGGNVNVNDKFGNAALWTAVMQPKPDLDLINLIYKNGGDPLQLNKATRSPLSMAETKNDKEILAIFGK
jgi:uncharacterized protein